MGYCAAQMAGVQAREVPPAKDNPRASREVLIRMPNSLATVSPVLLDQLRDPTDGSILDFHGDTGLLVSSRTGSRWTVIDGIPRFVSDEHLESFGRQWTRYEVAHDEEDRATFVAKTGVSLEQLRGLRVLDAGCGGGRYAKVCGEAGATVIGADHSRAVDKAQSLCAHLPNVGFVQADLKQLPLEPQSFDFVFSIGVMHHDADTRRVFDAVAKLVRSGGRYSVWLYRRNQWWQELINSGLRQVTRRLPHSVLEAACQAGAVVGGIPGLNRTLNKIVNFSAHPNYENRVCDTFDWWAPEFQHHHTTAELMDWYRVAGFDSLQELPPEKTGAIYLRVWERNLLIGSGVNVTGVRR